jgi:inner membrane protein
MPLPIAHGLVGASVVALCHPKSSFMRDWKLLLLGAILAISPDFDFFLIWSLHLGRGLHRGFTHSILVALIVTFFLSVIIGLSHIRVALACGAAFLSHGLLDFATTKRGGGVELLFPFSSARLKLSVIGISEFPYGFQLLEIIKSSVIELVLFTPMLLVILLVREYAASDFNSVKGAS